ncbi:MYXO-CTERM sorting domain-containing protein, partial [Hyalangium sp.]|uniref:MYXO-CTERM sorting domain-containing protein n=1 Tax=Hyalangium sp. TaxID=2028555 RepID=UPI002D2DD3DC
GVVLIRAGTVAGAGSFSARGLSVGPTTQGGDDGAGGGGAGGVISLRSAGELACGAAEASGGAGGDTVHPSFLMGPGGGGGGGFVFLQGEPLSCPVTVLAGSPGRSMSTGDSRGAGPASTDSGSSYGSDQSIPIALRVPATPTVTQPANGAVGVALRPRFEGVAEPGVMVQLFLDGVPYVRLAAGGTLGDFAYGAVADLSPGPHELRASAEVFGIRSPLSEPSRFDVVAPADGGVPDGGVADGGVADGGIGAGPIVVSPAEGEQVDPTPLVAGTSASGVSISLQVDGVEVARVPLDGAGRFYYTLTAAQALAPGEHSVTAQAWDAQGNPGLSSRTTTFEVLEPAELDVACGCGASPGVGLGAVALLLAAGFVRRRHHDRVEPQRPLVE